MPDALRLAIGTLTRLPVPAPRGVDSTVARWAMCLAVPVGAALGLVVGVAAWALARLVSTPAAPLLLAVLAVAALAYLTRGLHLDGLADTADALGSGRAAAGALEVARRSDIGPFGVITLVLVLLAQVAATSGLVAAATVAVGLPVAVGSGRLAITMACMRGIPAARPDGLGAAVAGSVPWWLFVLVGLAWTAACSTATAVGGLGAVLGAAAALAGLAAGGIVLRIAVRRLGGITGDVLGAVAELATTASLVILVALPT